MPIGPGKYDVLAAGVMKASGAEAAVVLVLGGAIGSGFSVQFKQPENVRRLIGALRLVAEQIEGDMKADRPIGVPNLSDPESHARCFAELKALVKADPEDGTIERIRLAELSLLFGMHEARLKDKPARTLLEAMERRRHRRQ